MNKLSALLFALAALAARALAGCNAGRDAPGREPHAPGARPEEPSAGGAATLQALVPVPRSELRITSGEIFALPSGLMSIEAPSVRAIAPAFAAPAAAIRFRYLGPTAETRRLSSGMVKRQIGLKLRARDSCNVLYAMWQIMPRSEIAVLVKRNPGEGRHGECGAQGYARPRPRRSAAAPEIGAGVWHTMSAEIDGGALVVRVDGAAVWEGVLDARALSLDGPVGVRADNGRFDFDLYAGRDAGGGG